MPSSSAEQRRVDTARERKLVRKLGAAPGSKRKSGKGAEGSQVASSSRISREYIERQRAKREKGGGEPVHRDRPTPRTIERRSMFISFNDLGMSSNLQ